MLGVLSLVVGFLVVLWMFYDLICPPPPAVDRQLGKPDHPVEYNLKHNVSHLLRISRLMLSGPKGERGTFFRMFPLQQPVI